MNLRDIKVGDIVYCVGDSGFCDSSDEKVERIEKRFATFTGKPYNVICLSGNRKFDARNGSAITLPFAYYIMTKEERIK